MRFQPSPADEAAGEGEEAFADVVAAVRADQDSGADVEAGKGAFDDPAVVAEPEAVFGLPARDHGFDTAAPDEAAVLVVVVAAVGDQGLRPSPWPADSAADGRHPVEQLHELGDVVAVAAGERPGKRDPAAVYEQMVLAPASTAIDRAATCFRTPFFACRWLESATARSHSS